MSNQRDGRRLFTRRAFVFTGLKVALGVAVVSRLGYLQIFRASHYKLLSDKNRIVAKQILPKRGKILDVNGKILSNNKSSYSAILDLMDIQGVNREEIINSIVKNTDLDDKVIEDLRNIPEKINRSNRFILLQENLEWDELAGYYIMSSTTPGIIVEKSQSRYYLYSKEISHLVGYTGSPTQEDVENSDNTSLSLPMAKIGKTGLEKEYDNELFGKTGIVHEEVNSRRKFVRCIDKIESVPGEDINLTINIDLQNEVYKILSQHESASCVVMDVTTGAVLAFVSYPGYDTNIFSKKIEKNVLKELYDNPYKPVINKVINGLYSPGSSFKMITGLAGLTAGVITEHTSFNCNGVYEIGRYKYHCWKAKYGGHGSTNLQKALAESCDVYFYNLARMISPDVIAKTANDFGLGLKTGIDLPGEKSGLVPTKKWKKQNKKQTWTPGDTLNMSIGQGFTLTTPLQLARMITILVNGLNPVTPYLRKVQDQLSPEKLSYKKEHIEIILDGMNDVVNSDNGTARDAETGDTDFDMGGKTGSTQVFRITEQQRKQGLTVSEDYWKKEHAIFVGYAPVDEPKFAVSVLVEHGGSGAHAAAPIARDALLAAKKYMGAA